MAKTKTVPQIGVSIWEDFHVRWDFVTPVYGGFPAADSVLAPFIEKKIKDGKIRAPLTKIELGAHGRVEVRAEIPSLEELHASKLEEALETVPDAETLIEERSLVFRRFHDSLALPGGNLRSHIKDCARVLSTMILPKKEKGVSGPSSLNVRATNGLYVAEDWIMLSRDGQFLKEPDDVEEFMVHVRDRNGVPMSSIKHCERVEPPVSVEFTLKLLRGLVTEQELNMIFEYAAVHGFGQERSRGMGRYTFTLEAAAEKAVA